MSDPLETAYEEVWKFAPPASCVAMHAAGLFTPKGPNCLQFATFEFLSAEEIAEDDVFVRESLADGFVPIGGDSTGDRWCFDTRKETPHPNAIIYCPHDMIGADVVAPTFEALVYRLIAFNLCVAHLWRGWGTNDAALRALTEKNLAIAKPWMRAAWIARLEALTPATWPKYEDFDAWMRETAEFAALPTEQIPQFR